MGIQTKTLLFAQVLILALFTAGCSSGTAGSGAEVTQAEYHAAAQAAAQCVRERGFEAQEPVEGSAGLYTIAVSTSDDGEQSAQAAQDAIDSCWNKHARSVEDRYVDGMALSGEEWEADYQKMVDCIEAAGVTGVRVGDEEGVVGSRVTGNDQAVDCLQAHMFKLFRGDAGK